jgi:hypothetical protein
LADEAGKTGLKNKIGNQLKNFFTAHANTAIQPSDITQLESSINTVIQNHLGITAPAKTLRIKTNPANNYSFDINSSFSLAVQQITTSTTNIAGANANLNGAGNLKSSFRNELNTQQQAVINTIDGIIDGSITLSKLSKELLTVPNSPGITEFKEYKLIDGLKALRTLCLVPNHSDLLFDGSERIQNSTIISSTKRHYESIYYLESIIRDIANGLLIGNTAGNPPANIFSNLSTLKTLIEGVAAKYRIIEAGEKLLDNINNTVPDLTTELVIAESQVADVISFPDVVTDKTPYISAEGGVGYATGLALAYSYYGTNFYFSPINKKGQLRNFKGLNLLKKVVCFNLGIANFFGTRRENTYSLLGKTSNSDIIAGAGFRLGRVIKINITGLPYKTNNDNPLSGKYKTKADFSFSIGADVNILKAFGDLARTLNIVK